MFMQHARQADMCCTRQWRTQACADLHRKTQGTPRCWRGGNGHDLLVCVFMCMLSCFSHINEMCVYCIFLYNLRLYREREREREDESQECSLYAIISPRLTAKLSPSLSFIPLRHFPLFLLRPVRLSSLFLFPSAVSTSSSLSGFSVCSCTSFVCLFHLKPSTPSSFSFLNIFSPHLMPSSPCYICAVHSSFCGCLSLVCLFPFDLPPNDSRLLFVRFRAWIWVCVQAHTCTSQFESVNDCPLRVQHAVYRASRFLSRTCCMIITLCSPDVFVTISPSSSLSSSCSPPSSSSSFLSVCELMVQTHCHT